VNPLLPIVLAARIRLLTVAFRDLFDALVLLSETVDRIEAL
jgi:hypothetical protein